MSAYRPLPKDQFDQIIAELKRARAQAQLERQIQQADARAKALLESKEAERRQPLEYAI